MTDLIVSGIGRRAQRGFARLGNLVMPCALGRGGRQVMKREGDGATPIGRWAIRAIYVRPAGLLKLRAAPPVGRVRLLRPDDGWCDDPDSPRYNRPVRHPHRASAERLWRKDHLYDVIIVLGYNDRPRHRHRGSAIFLHLLRRAEDGRQILPTEGCIGLGPRDLRIVLGRLGRGSGVTVLG